MENINYILPEIFISLGIMFLLILGVFKKDSSGLIITNIQQDSPINFLQVNNIIIEAQKKKIRSVKDFEKTISEVLQSNEKTMLIAIYNNKNQRRYIGIKLD